jgi:hypothetical protein
MLKCLTIVMMPRLRPPRLCPGARSGQGPIRGSARGERGLPQVSQCRIRAVLEQRPDGVWKSFAKRGELRPVFTFRGRGL